VSGHIYVCSFGAHAHVITSGRMTNVTFGHVISGRVTSGDVISGLDPVTSLPVAPPEIWLEPC
jgi:hypothetical protein